MKGKALPSRRSGMPTNRLRMLAGADEEAQSREEGHWHAGACPELVEGFWLHLCLP